ncbi:biopolymer transporter ExbD [bacterium]|nr:biopolymer transporter ExbD [bacterium]
MQFKKRNTKRLNLDITPLIDVIFLLLIFFMVSTTFITSPGIHINLPQATAKTNTDKPKSLEIAINETHKYFLNGKEIKKAVLKSELAAAKKITEFEQLIIRADGKVRHEEVVYVMDTANQIGLHKISIAIKPKSDDKTDAN